MRNIQLSRFMSINSRNPLKTIPRIRIFHHIKSLQSFLQTLRNLTVDLNVHINNGLRYN